MFYNMRALEWILPVYVDGELYSIIERMFKEHCLKSKPRTKGKRDSTALEDWKSDFQRKWSGTRIDRRVHGFKEGMLRAWRKRVKLEIN